MIELSDFSDSLLCEVLGRFDAPELCALACTCKRFHAFSSTLGEDYWRGLVEKRRYLSPHVTPKGKEAWKTVYKESFVKAKLRRQRAHQRKVIVIQMEIQDVNREIKTLKDEANDLINQERAETNLYEEIDRGRSAEVALKTWSPVSVSVWHKKVVEQTPVDVETRLEDLKAKLKVTKLLLRNVLQRIETKKRKLSDLEDSLQSVNLKKKI